MKCQAPIDDAAKDEAPTDPYLKAVTTPPAGGPDNGETWVAHLAPGGHGPVTVTVAFHRECDLLGIGVALRGDSDPVANRRKARAIAVGRAKGAVGDRMLRTHKVKLVPGPGAVFILESRLAWLVWEDEFGDKISAVMRDLRALEGGGDAYWLRVKALDFLTTTFARGDIDRAPTPGPQHWRDAIHARRVMQVGGYYKAQP